MRANPLDDSRSAADHVRGSRGVISAGDVYYLSPGHNLICEADGELIEFSPRGRYQETMEAVARNAQQRDAVTAPA